MSARSIHRVRALLGLACLLLALLVTCFFPWQPGPGGRAVTAPPQLSYRHCDLYGLQSHRASCFTYRSQSGARFHIPLTLLQHPSDTPRPQRELLILVPGGPGQGFFTEPAYVRDWANWLDEQGLALDLLLYDPRGTGDSPQAFHCQALEATQRRLLAQAPPLEQELQTMGKVLVQCFADFDQDLSQLALVAGQAPHRLSLFALDHQVQDLAGMVRALGYQRVHLWGVSYGSRVALAAAGLPEVKGLILDSAYPFERGLFSEWAGLYSAALDTHQRLYQQFTGKSFAQLLAKLKAELARQSPVLELESTQGQTQRVQMTGPRLLELAFYVLYQPGFAGGFYGGLEQLAAKGEVNQVLHLLVQDFADTLLDQEFNTMVYYASECSDNAPEPRAKAAAEIARFPAVEDYFLAQLDHDACKLANFHSPGPHNFVQGRRYADKPTLVFAGSLDPVTPLAWARALVETLPRARLVVLDNVGHGSLRQQDCRWSFLKSFIEHGDPDLPIHCETPKIWP